MFVANHHYLCGGVGPTSTTSCVLCWDQKPPLCWLWFGTKPPLFVFWLGTQTIDMCVVVWDQHHGYLCCGLGQKTATMCLCCGFGPTPPVCVVWVWDKQNNYLCGGSGQNHVCVSVCYLVVWRQPQLFVWWLVLQTTIYFLML